MGHQAMGRLNDGCRIAVHQKSPKGNMYFRVLSTVGSAVLLMASMQSCEVVGPAELIAAHSGLCVTVADGSTDDGANIYQDECDGSEAQRFTTSEQADGGFSLIAQHSGKCLTVVDVSGDLATARQQTCDGSDRQTFSWTDRRQLQASHSGECLEVAGYSLDPGADVTQYPCGDVPNQQFERMRLTDGANGKWDPVVELNLVPVAMSNLPSGDVLMWSAYDRFAFENGNERQTETAIFDPDTGELTNRLVGDTNHDFFCPGIANLADGRVLINGGTGAAETSIYNPSDDSWEDAPNMNTARGYNASATLADGSVLTMGGSWSGGVAVKDAEIYQDGAWSSLPGLRATGSLVTDDIEGQYRSDNHMWLFAWTDNRAFHAGPSKTMHWLDPAGQGSVTSVGLRGNDDGAMNGNAVMYDTGKILTVGGAPDYTVGDGKTSAHIIDIRNPDSVETRQIESMRYGRAYPNSVVLPTGEVVVVGGQRFVKQFSDDFSIMIPELFDPFTERWTRLAPMAIPRNYHSSALLLDDGRVMVGGGGLCGSCSANHPDVQILTPPYLLNSQGNPKPRPTLQLAPSSATYGSSIEITASDDASQFVLVRAANSTHSVSNGQRRLTLLSTDNGDGTFSALAPANGGIAPPGVYKLFALDDDGTPSLARSITIG